jgi:hypothetical protein
MDAEKGIFRIMDTGKLRYCLGTPGNSLCFSPQVRMGPVDF